MAVNQEVIKVIALIYFIATRILTISISHLERGIVNINTFSPKVLLCPCVISPLKQTLFPETIVNYAETCSLV